MFLSCNSLVTTFDDVESAVEYTSIEVVNQNLTKDTISVMTWNIRFGAGRIDWFGDHCGDRVLLTESEIIDNLNSIVNVINNKEIDILLVQEIDVDSKRSAYIDQVQYILNETHLNYGVYASMHQAQIIPFNGYGRINSGNAIFSRWELSDGERIQLDLMTDQDPLEQYFYLRRNIIKAKINVPEKELIYIVNTHLTAFATDSTKRKHVEEYILTLNKLNDNEFKFVSGGDLNSLPPVDENHSVPDFCNIDKCDNENYHYLDNGGPHKPGSYFEYDSTENSWLMPLYMNYNPAINFTDKNNSVHFTHSPGTNINLDRKLDYLFTNLEKQLGSGKTLQENTTISDHVPVTMKVVLQVAN